jgi:hypothetical protein
VIQLAKLLSHVWSITRGSVAGITYTANQYAQIIARARTSPVQPHTDHQQEIKQLFSEGSTYWRDYDQAHRDGWDSYALTVTFPGPLGPYSVPGRQLFLAGWTRIRYCELRGAVISFDDTPPEKAGLISGLILSYAPLPAPGDGFRLTIENPNDEDVDALLQASAEYNPTRLRLKGPWKSDLVWAAKIIASGTATRDFAGMSVGNVRFVQVGPVVDNGPMRIGMQTSLRCVATHTA